MHAVQVMPVGTLVDLRPADITYPFLWHFFLVDLEHVDLKVFVGGKPFVSITNGANKLSKRGGCVSRNLVVFEHGGQWVRLVAHVTLVGLVAVVAPDVKLKGYLGGVPTPAQHTLEHVLQVKLVEVLVDSVDVGLKLALTQPASCHDGVLGHAGLREVDTPDLTAQLPVVLHLRLGVKGYQAA